MVVIKKTAFIAAVMVMLLLANRTQARVSMVVNGSFESDNRSISDITVEAPQRWCDVNLPANKFGGWVGANWSTHGNYSLTLYVEPVATNSGDIAKISQQVYLHNVNQIIFDLKLSSALSFLPWVSQIRSALVLIDGEPVWDSNDYEPDENGQYLNQHIDVNDFNDANSHTLSLAVRTNINDTPDVEYYSQWDFVKFDTYCGGFGYLPEDLTHDCYVDFADFAALAGHWLEQNPAYEYDLVEDGIIDAYDLMVFAGSWLDYRDWQNWQDPDFLELELLLSDIDDSGEVYYGDVLVLADDWLASGSCIRADLNRDGIVNFRDFAILTNEWLLKSWLYGIDD